MSEGPHQSRLEIATKIAGVVGKSLIGFAAVLAVINGWVVDFFDRRFATDADVKVIAERIVEASEKQAAAIERQGEALRAALEAQDARQREDMRAVQQRIDVVYRAVRP